MAARTARLVTTVTASKVRNKEDMGLDFLVSLLYKSTNNCVCVFLCVQCASCLRVSCVIFFSHPRCRLISGPLRCDPVWRFFPFVPLRVLHRYGRLWPFCFCVLVLIRCYLLSSVCPYSDCDVFLFFGLKVLSHVLSLFLYLTKTSWALLWVVILILINTKSVSLLTPLTSPCVEMWLKWNQTKSAFLSDNLLSSIHHAM